MKNSNKNKKTKRILVNLVAVLIFLSGLGVLIYPEISNIYYRIEANEQVSSFKQERSKLEQSEIDRRMKLAEDFNHSLNNKINEDPYDPERAKKGRAEYARMLELHEKMGVITIPSIDVELPIYAGTSEDVLEMGAGHLEGTTLPIGGNSTHSVITAHTGLPKAKLFTDLVKVKIGDRFYIENIKETLAYVVDDISIIEPTDFSKLLIYPGHDYVTLLTCTPYGINTHRLLVRGHRVDYVKAVDEKIVAENKVAHTYKYLFYVSLIVIFLLFIYLLYLIVKKRRAEREIKRIEKEKNKALATENSETIDVKEENELKKDKK